MKHIYCLTCPLKLHSWPILVLVVLLAVGCSTQVEPEPVVDGQSETDASATVKALDEGPVATVPVPPSPVPTATLEPTVTSSPIPDPTPTETPAPIPASMVEAQVTNVVDGDTIDVLIDGQEYRVRYIGIDTPETVHPTLGEERYGSEASDYNKSLVLGQRVFLEKDVSETDQYGRLLRYVWLDEVTMVNALLVAEGYAQVTTFPPDVKHVNLFLELERVAREDALGLWGLPTDPVMLETPEPLQEDTPAPVQGGNCDPSYPDDCIPPYPPIWTVGMWT
jgi:endonuclease YncB( thermonuclease family)